MHTPRSSILLPIALAVAASAILLLATATGAPAGTEEDELWGRANLIFDPLPTTAPNQDNPVTAAKVALGQRLYFDPALSRAGHVSCESCHSLARFGVDGQPTSPGDGGERGQRNSPTVFNAALHVAQFWDGRAADVEAQAGMPVLNPVEMAIPSEQFLVDRLAAVEGYPDAFAEAFPGDPAPLSYLNIGRALAAFERTLLTPAPFDAYLQGDRAALSPEQRDGLQLFMSLGCSACHNGATVGARFFRKFGLQAPYWTHTRSRQPDPGRFALTGDEADRYVFKVASLRNVAETGPYFHDGSVETLEEAVRIMARLQVGVELQQDQAARLVAFLRSLSGEMPETARQALERQAGH